MIDAHDAKDRFVRSLTCGSCAGHDDHDVCDRPNYEALVEWIEAVERTLGACP